MIVGKGQDKLLEKYPFKFRKQKCGNSTTTAYRTIALNFIIQNPIGGCLKTIMLPMGNLIS